MADPQSTRERLIEQGLRLFAAHGFAETSVGDIEEAAGLQPRRGALYKHFGSKEELLAEVVRRATADAMTVSAQIEGLDLNPLATADAATLRPLIGLVGHWFLAEMDRLEQITRVFEHDADRLSDFAADVRTHLVDNSYATTTAILTAVAPGLADAEATSILVLGPLVAARRTVWTYRRAPLGVDDERLLRGWTEQVLDTILRARAA